MADGLMHSTKKQKQVGNCLCFRAALLCCVCGRCQVTTLVLLVAMEPLVAQWCCVPPVS